MEGPTPVSALIHAATMVTAGVYMVGRNAVLFSHAPMTMEIVAIVGVLTAVMAASIGLVQTDIKRVLAYSTVSQLGYMFVAMGVGAFAAGAFHLMTHAFFKALLFLCSGAVIHAMAGEQNMLKMGGLRKHMPVTFWTMMIGTVAIAGIPPFAGFFSKDEILLQAFLKNKLVYGLAAFAALMTAFYMFRLMSLTFFGAYRGPAWETAGHGARGGAGRRAGGIGGAWRPRRLARAPRRAEADDVRAGRAGRRRGAGRIRRRADGARRRQRHRALPAPLLRCALAGDSLGRSHGGASRRAGGGIGRRGRRRARRGVRSRAGRARSRPPGCRTPANWC